ncbi:MAG: hypothetical protein RL277_266 [Planctomycetota bacterium]
MSRTPERLLFLLASFPLSCSARTGAVMPPPSASAASAKGGTPAEESAAERDARMQWFRDAHFGMFIHWGLYSQLAGEWRDQTVMGGAEWIQNYLSIPSSQYSPLAKSFNPQRFDADEWLALMSRAGVRYIAVTTKHHDGFCLWPTRQNTDWNIAMTPFGRDPIRELAQACERHGVRMGMYHSVLDWRHPDWPVRPAYNDYAQSAPDKERFRAYLHGQLKELLTGYGPVSLLWFDGTWDRDAWTSQDGKQLEDYARSLQPGIVINNRSGYLPPQKQLGFEVANSYGYVFAGDYISPEGEVPPTGLPGIDWETCQTMQLPNNWGYNRLVGFRSFPDLLRQLVDVTSKGGNMLLNIGPDADGKILPQARRCLEKFGDWMSVNSESIHGTRASPFAYLPFDGRCTQKAEGARTRLYLHVWQWPTDQRLRVPATNRVARAYLLSDPQRTGLQATSSARGIELTLPKAAPDAVDSVVVVEIEGQAQVLPALQEWSLGKSVEVSSQWPGREKELNPQHITDGKLDTLFAAEETTRTAWARMDLGAERAIEEVLLSDAPYGRTQEFVLEARVGQEWVRVVGGSKIGKEWRAHFEPVTAREWRWSIVLASDTPVMAEWRMWGR